MPTLVAALTLAALLKMAHVEQPRWHLAFWFGLLVGVVLMGHMPRWHAVGQGLLSFLGAWGYFVLLDLTDNKAQRELHWLILLVGFVALVGSRFWVDVRLYGVGL